MWGLILFISDNMSTVVNDIIHSEPDVYVNVSFCLYYFILALFVLFLNKYLVYFMSFNTR